MTQRQKHTTAGDELEVMLTTPEGIISNRAPELLNAIRGTPMERWVVREALDSQLEVITDPHPTITGLYNDLAFKLQALEELCAPYGIVPVPASEMGAGRGILNKKLKRLELYDRIIGIGEAKRLMKFSGTHTNHGWPTNKELRPHFYNIQQALDSTYGFTSTSPISPEGLTGMNSWRVFTFRHGIQSQYGDDVLGNGLQEYVTSMEEIDQRALAKWIQWRDIAKKQGRSTLFGKLFKPENTGYIPVRKKEAWNESRGNDATTFPLAIAATAYVKGVLDHALREGLPITYATEDNTWQFQPGKRIILPNYATRVALDEQAMKYGMEKKGDPRLRDFHAEVLAFANLTPFPSLSLMVILGRISLSLPSIIVRETFPVT